MHSVHDTCTAHPSNPRTIGVVPGVLHLVMGRGIERRKIFWNDKDRTDFIDRLARVVEQGGMDIYAWALIPNHLE